MIKSTKCKISIRIALTLLVIVCLLGFFRPSVIMAGEPDSSESAYAAEQSASTGSVEYYTDYDEVCAYLRGQLAARATTITFSVETGIVDSLESVYDFFDDAMEYYRGCANGEGDTLLNEACMGSMKIYSYGAYKTLETSVSYYTDAEQETELNALIKQKILDLKLDGKSDFEKTRIIFDFVCDNVNYDYENLNDSTYTMKQTAYAAMVDGKAVCQGYAVLFYRMCIEAGVECRVVLGWGNGTSHAWNIVKIGDYWYNVDSTWDGQDEATTHDWFLLNENDFINHTRNSKYSSEEFMAQYPMAMDSWKDYSQTVELPNYSNLSESKYYTVDDEIVTNQANGKPKVLVFFRSTCGNSQYTIKSICNNMPEGIDIIAINIDNESKDSVKTFRETYGNDNVKFVYAIDGYTYNSSQSFAYYRLFSSESSYILPLTVYIDADNRVQYYTTSAVSASGVQSIVTDYCMGGMNWELDLKDTIETGSANRARVFLNGMERNQQFFSWESSNEAVARVDASGNVIAVKSGSAVISCKAGEAVIADKEINIIDSSLNGLQFADGEWSYYVNGKVDTGYTGLINNGGSWWYIVNGVLADEFTGIVENGAGKWYVKNGKIDVAFTGLGLYEGVWYCVQAGKVNMNYTGLVLNAGIWWNIKDGILDVDYTGPVTSGGTVWYVRNGKLDTSFSGIGSGKDGFWYVTKGKVNVNYTGLVNYNDAWWYVVDGKVAADYTGAVTNSAGIWYVKNGKIDTGFKGLYYDGTDWICVRNGKIDMTYTGLILNGGSWWYVIDGKLASTYTGQVEHEGKTWNIVNGKLV